jgi:hypothetical protein
MQKLEDLTHAIRVINMVSQIIQGKIKGKAVIIPFSISIYLGPN